MAGDRLHADDTPVPVLAPGTGKTSTGRLWAYLRDERPYAGAAAPAVRYRYTADRRGEHPRAHLTGFGGVLQADGMPGLTGFTIPAVSRRQRAGLTCGASSTTSTPQVTRQWR